jgi:hypothetical protein
LPIGVYVTPQIESELSAGQKARIVPVKPMNGHPDLSFIKMKEGIKAYLPLETLALLREKPDSSQAEIIKSIKASFQNQNAAPVRVGFLQPRYLWEILGSAVQDEDVFIDKWEPWILAHLGKQDEIVRTSK